MNIDVPELLTGIEFDALEDCVLLSGSVVEGFGNLLSDIDLFVVSEANTGHASHMYADPGTRRWVDLQCVAQPRIRDVLDAVNRNAGRFPEDFGVYEGPRLAAIDLYHRLAIAVPLTRVSLPTDLRSQFDLLVLARELCFVYIVFARSAWQDCVGAYASRHYEQANYVAERVIDHVIDAYAALMGETYVGEKWRWARLARIRLDPLDLKARYPDRHAYFGSPAPVRAAGRMVTARDLLYQTMHLALIGSSDSNPPSLSVPTWRLDIHRGTVRVIDEWGSFR